MGDTLPAVSLEAGVTSWPIRVDPLYRCWIWEGEEDEHGYPILWRRGSRQRAHRIVYRAELGPIPDGLELDHLCRRRSCVNPAHMEPVQRSENERRKAWRYRVRRKTCPCGHDLFTNALRTPEGGHVCRACA